jgi:hypothetical protein
LAFFNISQNAPGAIIDLPNLGSIGAEAWLDDFSSLNIPNLQFVNGSLNISNAKVSRFSAPNLRNVYGNFSLTGNFSEYVLVSESSSIIADGRLFRVDLPALSAVNGDVYVRGATDLNCSSFKYGFITGTFDCDSTNVPLSTSITTSPISPATSHTSTTSSTAPATPTASHSSTGLSSAAKGGIGGGVAGGALLIIALAVWYFWHKRRSSRTLHKFLPELSSRGEAHEEKDRTLVEIPNETLNEKPALNNVPVEMPAPTSPTADFRVQDAASPVELASPEPKEPSEPFEHSQSVTEFDQ